MAAVPCAKLVAEMAAAWPKDHPSKPQTRAEEVLFAVQAYARLAAGWDPTKEDDYAEFAAHITELVGPDEA